MEVEQSVICVNGILAKDMCLCDACKHYMHLYCMEKVAPGQIH